MAEQARASAEPYAIERTSALLIQHYERLVVVRPARRENRWRMAWQRLVDRLT
jgi:hypothetical protein